LPPETGTFADMPRWPRRSAPPGAPAPADPTPGDHEDAWWDRGDLAEKLHRAGHRITVTDTSDTAVPTETQAHVQAILQESVDALLQRARRPQRLRLRIRIDAGDLVLSMQSSEGAADDPGISLTATDLAALRRRVAAAGGRMTVRATPTGNWLAVAFLPLHRGSAPTPPTGPRAP